jgi:hypothetical protein
MNLHEHCDSYTDTIVPLGKCKSDRDVLKFHYADAILSNDFSHIVTRIEVFELHLSKMETFTSFR